MLAVVIQLAYVLYFFVHSFSITSSKSVPHESGDKNRKPVSVIICAKNEANNLKNNLPVILAQRYMNEAGMYMYEVIVVNDASTDTTNEVLALFDKEYAHLKVINLTNEGRDLPGKKYALRKAVAEAKYDMLLLTDADCKPVGEEWLSHMVAPLHKGKQIVAGYGKFQAENGWLNAFIRWETMHTFLQYSSYAAAGKPYMAVGRNLACTKEALQKAQTAEVWGALPSGDDDLLIRSVANRDNMAIVSHPGSFTISGTITNVGDWIKQKQRHLSTGKYYKPSVIALLGVYASAHALAWLLFFVMLFTAYWQIILGVMAVRSVVYWIIWWYMANSLEEKKIIKWFPLFDIGWMVYNFAFSPYILWKTKRQWK